MLLKPNQNNAKITFMVILELRLPDLFPVPHSCTPDLRHSTCLILCKCDISLSCFALTPSWGDPILSSPGPRRSKSAVQTTPDGLEL